jgi:hypothetical protein
MGKTFCAVALCAATIFPGAASAVEPGAPEKVSFYFAAHQDDWQLFMNPSAFLDVANPKTKTVFIHVTAGDAGSGTGKAGRRFPLYLARENGADAAIRFMADANSAPVKKVRRTVKFAGHRVERTTYRGTVSYFLRLPDGGPDGQGYAVTARQSLSRLNNGAAPTLTAVDRSATYRGWQDLVTTVRAIIDFERAKAPGVQLNVAETDPAINPGDHSDHQMTARLALDAGQSLECARRIYYVDYASSKLPENLSAQQRDMESAVFAVTLAGVLALDHTVSWSHYDKSFVGRNYFRVEPGNGTACHGSALEVTASASPKR